MWNSVGRLECRFPAELPPKGSPVEFNVVADLRREVDLRLDDFLLPEVNRAEKRPVHAAQRVTVLRHPVIIANRIERWNHPDEVRKVKQCGIEPLPAADVNIRVADRVPALKWLLRN